jgi:hypothetical protein
LPNAITAKIDTSDFRRVAEQIRMLGPSLGQQLTLRIREAAEEVAEQAKKNAGWSKEIPKTIKVASVKGSTAEITAGGKYVPTAKWYEAGKTASGRWRHPLFGNTKKWYPQTRPLRPFLTPALEDQRPNIEAKVATALTDAIHAAGLDA